MRMSQKVINITLIISIALNIYFIAFNAPKPDNSTNYLKEIESAREAQESYKNRAKELAVIVDSLELLSVERYKAKVIYIKERNENKKTISSISDDSLVSYLDSIFSIRGTE